MSWRDLFGGRRGGLERIEQHLHEMLDADRETLELASSGLLGSVDPEGLRRRVSDSDHRVNMLVQQVRRELVVHATLHGAQTDIGAMFATMSIVKDIERIGDYAKKLLRPARVRGPFTEGTAEHTQLTAHRDRIAGYLTDVRAALELRDAERAAALITEIQALTDELDTAIDQLLVADPPPADGAARALVFYYLARITSHLSNVLTSIVVPLDKLDFYDEPRADRTDGSG